MKGGFRFLAAVPWKLAARPDAVRARDRHGAAGLAAERWTGSVRGHFTLKKERLTSAGSPSLIFLIQSRNDFLGFFWIDFAKDGVELFFFALVAFPRLRRNEI
jgi:hypothetical protein